MSGQLIFGDFQLDCLNDTLLKGEETISLTPKAFRLLRYLAESGGRLLRKDELLEAVWPGLVVGDAALNVCISEIRKALGDQAGAPRYIQTVHKRGYRFIASLEEAPPHEKPKTVEETVSLQGRDEIFERLTTAYDRANQGRRQLIFLNGEPGIGKTSVVEAFSARLRRSREAYIGHGFCVDHNATAEAYLPVLDALGDLCRDAETDDIIAVLERHAPSWLMQLPALTDHEKRRRLSQQMGEISQERMLRELAGALETIAKRKPVVLFLEDLHWSDVASVDLLAYFAQRPERARIIIVATYRPVDVILRQHPLKKLTQALLAHGLCEDIPLELLDPMAVYDYLALRFPHCDQLERLATKIFEQTEGNPLFMVNLVTYLLDRSFIAAQDGVWRVQQDLETLGISDNLRGMIVQQLENQTPENQELLKIMSVAGPRPTLAEIAAAAAFSEEAIESRCEHLEKCSVFIRFRGVEEWPDGTMTGGFEFNHAVYQNVLYDQLSPLRRMRLHLAMGKRLAQAFQTDHADRLLDMAEHFTQGRDYEHAIDYWHLAAETSLQRQAYHEAATHLDQGLALLDGIRDSEQRLRLELELRMALGPVLIAKRGNASRRVGQPTVDL